MLSQNSGKTLHIQCICMSAPACHTLNTCFRNGYGNLPPTLLWLKMKSHSLGMKLHFQWNNRCFGQCPFCWIWTINWTRRINTWSQRLENHYLINLSGLKLLVISFAKILATLLHGTMQKKCCLSMASKMRHIIIFWSNVTNHCLLVLGRLLKGQSRNTVKCYNQFKPRLSMWRFGTSQLLYLDQFFCLTSWLILLLQMFLPHHAVF